MMLNEQISFGGRRVAGFHLVGIAQVPGDPGDVPLVDLPIIVQVDFSSDRPVTPQEFFALVGAVQEELIPAERTISFMALTESTFRGVFEIPQLSLPPGTMIVDAIPVGESADIQGVKFTITSAAVLDREAPPPANGLAPAPVPTPTPAPAPIEEEEKKKISTAAIVGIGVAVVAVGGGVIYVATRKKKRRKRAA